ncbi:MAG: prepilin peptidase [Bacteroidales bacterium]|nr:prepilin peptidase [Clostridium sp.]MCM1204311.1 prepilin peptidase [Bacteroidales bacterium]
MEIFLWGILIPLLARAVYTDVRQNRIENRLMVLGMLAALLYAWVTGGAGGMLAGLKTAGIVLLSLFLLFVLKGIGAGDIKLLLVLAVFFPDRMLELLISAFFIAALIALGRMAVRAFRKQNIYYRRETIHFSVPVALGTILLLVRR